MLLPLLLVEEMECRLEWGSGCAEGKKIDEEGDEAVSWVCCRPKEMMKKMGLSWLAAGGRMEKESCGGCW